MLKKFMCFFCPAKNSASFYAHAGNRYCKRCDPDYLVQCPNSFIPPKSIGEGARSQFRGRPRSRESVSCSRATPDLYRRNFGNALEQQTFGKPQVYMQSLFAKSHTINFQNEGRHAMEQNQAMNAGDGVDDGFLVCNMTCRKRSHHYKNLRRHGWSMPLSRKC